MGTKMNDDDITVQRVDHWSAGGVEYTVVIGNAPMPSEARQKPSKPRRTLLGVLRNLTAEWACAAWRRASKLDSEPSNSPEYQIAHWLHMRFYRWEKDYRAILDAFRSQFKNGLS